MRKLNKLQDLEYEVVEFDDGITEVNLRDLFIKPYEELPYLCDAGPCIYLITNLDNGKVYVGQTKSLCERFRGGSFSHINCLSCSENLLYRAIRKYHSRNFKVEILENSIDDLDEREIYYISYFSSFNPTSSTLGYNMTS